MSIFRRFRILAVLVIIAVATQAPAQTAHERALIAAFQSGDENGLRRAAAAIEQGVDAGFPVSSRGPTATFGLLAEAMFAFGDIDETLRYYKRAVDAAWSEGLWTASDGVTVRYEFGNTLMLKGRQSDALAVILELVRDLDNVGALEGKAGRSALISLSSIFMELQEWENMEAVSRDILAFAEAERPRDDDHVLLAANGIAFALRAQDRAAEAIPFSRLKLEIARELHPSNIEVLLTARIQLGAALEESGQFFEARQWIEGVLSEIQPNTPRLQEIETEAKRRLARIDKAEGQYLDFRLMNRDVMEAMIASGTPDLQLQALEALADRMLGEFELGTYANLLQEIIDLVDATPELPQERGAAARVKLANTRTLTGIGFASAKVLMDDALATLHATLGPDHLETLRAEAEYISLRRSEASAVNELRTLGIALAFSDGGPDAASYNDDDLDILRRRAEAEAESKGRLNGMVHFINLASALTQAGKLDAALSVLDSQEDIDTKVQAGGISLDTHLGYLRNEARGLVHLEAGQFASAVDAYEGGLGTLLSSLRELSWVSALGGGEYHRVGKLYGDFYATASWHAGRDKTGDQALRFQQHAFRATQLAGYGPASAAVARPAVRRASGDPELQQLISEFEALSQFSPKKVAESSRELLESAGQRRTRERRLSQLHAEIDARFPEYFGMQVPGTISLAEITGDESGPPLIGLDEALIVVLPIVELKETKRAISGLVLAITLEEVAWAEIPIPFRQFSEDVSVLHLDLDPGGRAPDHLAALRAPLGSVQPEENRSADTAGFYSFDRAARLHHAIFGAPEVARVIGGKPNWTIVPYGAALTVPYAALVTDDPGEEIFRSPSELRKVSWLGHEKALTVVPSISALKSLRTRPKAPRFETTLAYLGIGDPVFQGNENAPVPSADQVLAMRGSERSLGIRSLPRLPGTRREVEALADFFQVGPEAIALGDKATEDFVRGLNASGDLSRARIVHFATHGLLSGAFQGLSEPALALTPPSDDTAQGLAQSDGLLTASEAAQLELNADWVILSACDTAGNEGIFGDGLGGLAQGFFSAGAQSLLISQWRVDDRAAERLTTGAVTLAEQGVPKAEALRRTMRNLAADVSRDGAQISNAHPSVWAPFLLVGGG